MAEEFVRTVQFDEFSRRIGERFVGLETKIEQGLAHAAKEREQNFVHLNQRLDDLKESVNQRFDDMNRGINQRFDDMNRGINQRFEGVNQRFEGVNQRFDSLEKLLNWQNRMMMGIFAVILAAAVKYLFFPG